MDVLRRSAIRYLGRVGWDVGRSLAPARDLMDEWGSGRLREKLELGWMWPTDFLWVGEERCRRSCVKRGRRSSNSCLSVQVCRVRTDERWVLEEHRKDVS